MDGLHKHVITFRKILKPSPRELPTLNSTLESHTLHFTCSEIVENTVMKFKMRYSIPLFFRNLSAVFNFFAETLIFVVAFSVSYLLRECSLFLFLSFLKLPDWAFLEPFSFPFLSQNYFLQRSLYCAYN